MTTVERKSPALDISTVIALDPSVVLPGALASACPQLFAAAQKSLRDMQFPTTRMEHWKYTRTTRLSSEKWTIRRNENHIDISRFEIPGLDAHTFVFVNGFIRKDLCKFVENGWRAESFDSISHTANTLHSELNTGIRVDEHIFSTLSVAYNTGGVVIEVDEKFEMDKPFRILFLQSGENTFACPWVVVKAKALSKASIILSHHSLDGGRCWLNASVQLSLGKGAKVSYTKIQDDANESAAVFMERVVQQDDTHTNLVCVTLKGGWIRNNLNISLDGTNCESFLSGCYAPRGDQHVDNHTVVDHLKPHSMSNELYKGVVSDHGRAVFNGKVFVRYQAQKTNAFQTNANLLMSDGAIVNSKPELEIYADDVKCSHGCTIGQLDEEALFYLKSRGLSEDGAKKMLVTAFMNDVLERIDHDHVRMHVRNEMIANGVMVD